MQCYNALSDCTTTCTCSTAFSKWLLHITLFYCNAVEFCVPRQSCYILNDCTYCCKYLQLQILTVHVFLVNLLIQSKKLKEEAAQAEAIPEPLAPPADKPVTAQDVITEAAAIVSPVPTVSKEELIDTAPVLQETPAEGRISEYQSLD